MRDARAETIDFVLIRESTEGLFSTRGQTLVEDDRVARDVMEITRPASERLFDFSFRLARHRRQQGKPGQVICVDKANVLTSLAFFRKIFDERALLYDDIEAGHAYVQRSAIA